MQSAVHYKVSSVFYVGLAAAWLFSVGVHAHLDHRDTTTFIRIVT
jgi:hypothetical protein